MKMRARRAVTWRATDVRVPMRCHLERDRGSDEARPVAKRWSSSRAPSVWGGAGSGVEPVISSILAPGHYP
jgi:hypothetical protein